MKILCWHVRKKICEHIGRYPVRSIIYARVFSFILFFYRNIEDDDPFRKDRQGPEEPAEEDISEEDEIPTIITEAYIMLHAQVVELIEQHGFTGSFTEDEIMEIVKTLLVHLIYQVVSSAAEA